MGPVGSVMSFSRSVTRVIASYMILWSMCNLTVRLSHSGNVNTTLEKTAVKTRLEMEDADKYLIIITGGFRTGV